VSEGRALGAIPLGERLRVSTLFACCCTSSYLLINHLNAPPLRAPTALVEWEVDRAIPFLAWTVWPYIALLFTDFFFPLLIGERAFFRRVMRAYAATAALSALTWLALPTTLPRVGFVPAGETLSERTYLLLISMDPPNNCFPSGHISIPTVLFWALARQWPRWAWASWLSLGLLSLTILTTKQHYLIDLLGGLAAGAAGLWVTRERGAGDATGRRGAHL